MRSFRFGVPARLLAATAVCAALVTGCGGTDDTKGTAAPADAAYPMKLANAWGSAEVKKKPERVAVVSDGDISIALALGITPVIAPDVEAGSPMAEYKKNAVAKVAGGKLKTYKTADGTDYEAIAAEAPDVILAMNSWDVNTDYAKLSPIAPVVTYTDKKHADTLTWQERLRTAAKALGLSGKAEEVIKANQKVVDDAVATHPQFKGKTYTYAVVHPEQVSFMSYGEQDPGVFEQLGFQKTANAAKYKVNSNAISLENLDKLDADVLLVAYPFGDRGLLSASELESNKIFTSLPSVKEKRFAVLPSDNGLASTMAYPDALSYPWVVQQLTPILEKVVKKG
ncbi:ABC transporter substrate-binding protein [Actinomadura hibisca]|uniref:ABC transporter substrate-binding protein n=1 Tax=Actinomadura hibisca TaxID=68565 RepID=UPI00082A6D7D|nr:ABC transporter substrate-binding protein [Actinomadura hibisca]